MVILGVAIGPYGFNLLQPEIMNISTDFPKIPLIVILLRAGIGISREDLIRVGAPALRMSCIPGMVEGFFHCLCFRCSCRIYLSSCL